MSICQFLFGQDRVDWKLILQCCLPRLGRASIVGLQQPIFTPTKKSRPIFTASPWPYNSVSADLNHIIVYILSKSPILIFRILLYSVCKWVKKRCDLVAVILQTSTHAMFLRQANVPANSSEESVSRDSCPVTWPWLFHSRQLVDRLVAPGHKPSVWARMLLPALGENQSHHGDGQSVMVGGFDESEQHGVCRSL